VCTSTSKKQKTNAPETFFAKKERILKEICLNDETHKCDFEGFNPFHDDEIDPTTEEFIVVLKLGGFVIRNKLPKQLSGLRKEFIVFYFLKKEELRNAHPTFRDANFMDSSLRHTYHHMEDMSFDKNYLLKHPKRTDVVVLSSSGESPKKMTTSGITDPTSSSGADVAVVMGETQLTQGTNLASSAGEELFTSCSSGGLQRDAMRKSVLQVFMRPDEETKAILKEAVLSCFGDDLMLLSRKRRIAEEYRNERYGESSGGASMNTMKSTIETNVVKKEENKRWCHCDGCVSHRFIANRGKAPNERLRMCSCDICAQHAAKVLVESGALNEPLKKHEDNVATRGRYNGNRGFRGSFRGYRGYRGRY
jgi:hypothetical protein